jgi:hypothetical protein
VLASEGGGSLEEVVETKEIRGEEVNRFCGAERGGREGREGRKSQHSRCSLKEKMLDAREGTMPWNVSCILSEGAGTAHETC